MTSRARVLVISGSYGAGHDAAAAAIAWQLEHAGLPARVLDIVDYYPWGLGRLLRSLYLLQLKLLPQTWGWLLSLLAERDQRGIGRIVVALLAWLPSQRLAEAIDDDIVSVVSTHPFASASLGRLRARGQLDIPVVTYLTDPSVHSLWVHDGVDRHLAIYPEAARQARGHGATDVVLVRPAIEMAPTPRPPAVGQPRRVLAELGIPTDRPVVLVVGGSEGVGALAASAADVAATGVATVVVACGHNEHLWEELASTPNLVALRWVDRLRDVVGAADCLVQNAGGFTVLEALAAGTPVVSYRCLPGHGTDNAEALSVDGLAGWAHDQHQLRDALVLALASARRTNLRGARPSVSEVIGQHLVEAIPA